jgi:hypothetical protein
MWKILKEIFDIGHEIGNNKSWYYSKTLWFNVAALIAAVVDYKAGGVTSQQDIQTIGLGLFALVNLVLRLTTKRPIGGKKNEH